MTAFGFVDRDGVYGAVQFVEAAGRAGLATVFGAELSLGEGVLTALACGPAGYRSLSHLITNVQMAGGGKGV